MAWIELGIPRLQRVPDNGPAGTPSQTCLAEGVTKLFFQNEYLLQLQSSFLGQHRRFA